MTKAFRFCFQSLSWTINTNLLCLSWTIRLQRFSLYLNFGLSLLCLIAKNPITGAVLFRCGVYFEQLFDHGVNHGLFFDFLFVFQVVKIRL